ncbi:GntR family transcriptional regulator [Pararhizobium sp. IMCC21322]|uniref:GntR family transcriptional regulator n=1 Tax=Pararhizobium sp. IMCC21322 TaxID=3067903 RepID=UPI00274124B0|nr:GntR family transcriptional regulator [Pararhizobium sp. IMCC21322]
MNSTLSTIKPVRRETLQTAVYEQLCELILEGNLAPGESITVANIAKAFDVSPMPVREAITRLMAAGALTVVSGRSIGVPQLDRSVFTDLRNVRLEIETVSLRWAIQNATEAFHRDLEDKLSAMISAEQKGEVKGFIRANYEFHFAIYQQAKSPVLLETISKIWLRINPYFHLLQQSGHYKISNDQHSEMVEGIVQNDENKAVEALKRDISSAYNTMVSQLAGKKETSQ